MNAASPAPPSPPPFGARADEYARARRGFPPAFFERLRAQGLTPAGARALDLGTGTGTVALGLAALGLRVVALDRSRALLLRAGEAAAASDLEVELVEGQAEDTGLPAGSFDLVTAGQCWHWFDRPRAIAEVARLLRPGGHLVLAHLDWLILPGGVTDRTLRVVERFGSWPAVTGLGQHGHYPLWSNELHLAGFEGLESFSFDVDLPYSAADWRSRLHASAALCALEPTALDAFDAECATALAGEPEPYRVPHRAYAAWGRWPGTTVQLAGPARG